MATRTLGVMCSYEVLAEVGEELVLIEQGEAFALIVVRKGCFSS